MSLANEAPTVVGFASQQRLCLVNYAEIFRKKLLCCLQAQIYPQTVCLVKVLLGKDWLSFLCIPAYGAVSLKFCFIPKKDKLGLLCGVALI